jgi:hypothetical protein
METEDLGLPELKERAKAGGYTRISRLSGNTPAVPLDSWNGVTPETATAFMYTLVTCTLCGSIVIARKHGEQDIEYFLS